MEEYSFFVYIISNHSRTTFYIGFTNDIIRRIIEHKYGFGSKFAKMYNLQYLIYFEEYQYADEAITREKELKGWIRKKKIELIKKINPKMNDLSEKLFKDTGITENDIIEYIQLIKENRNNR